MRQIGENGALCPSTFPRRGYIHTKETNYNLHPYLFKVSKLRTDHYRLGDFEMGKHSGGAGLPLQQNSCSPWSKCNNRNIAVSSMLIYIHTFTMTTNLNYILELF